MTSAPSTFYSEALAIIDNHASEKWRALLVATLHHAPTETGKLNVAANILQAFDMGTKQWNLDEIAESYWENIIAPFHAAAGKTPPPSEGPSRGEPFDWEEKFELGKTIRGQRRLQKLALVRDRYICALTGRADLRIFKAMPGTPPSTLTESTAMSHIVPFSLGKFNDDKDEKMGEGYNKYWTALQAFSGVDLSALLDEGINSIDNIITLSMTAHKLFAELKLALEPVPDSENTYKPLAWGDEAPYLAVPARITLESTTDDPVPNPFYLSLHCAICKIFWASGQGEKHQALLNDLEGHSFLANDGSTAGLINAAFLDNRFRS